MNKICPLGSNNIDEVECVADKCAWYDTDKNMCVALRIGKQLDDIDTRLYNIMQKY